MVLKLLLEDQYANQFSNDNTPPPPRKYTNVLYISYKLSLLEVSYVTIKLPYSCQSNAFSFMAIKLPQCILSIPDILVLLEVSNMAREIHERLCFADKRAL